MSINTNVVMYIILLLIILILIYFLLNKTKEGFNYKINNNKCDSNQCPISSYQNDIYKLHHNFVPMRQKNDMLIKHTESGNWFNKSKRPNNIFIVRHAEKHSSKLALDCNGILRSSYIPQLIETFNQHGFGIDSIITTNEYGTMHQQQTILLTSWLFNIPTFIYGDDKESEKAVKQIFSKKYFYGKNILFCWEHTCIQTLFIEIMKMSNQKFDKSKLPYWTKQNFQSIYHIDTNFNFNLLEENFTTCYKKDNNLVTFGKVQKCG